MYEGNTFERRYQDFSITCGFGRNFRLFKTANVYLPDFAAFKFVNMGKF